MPTRGFPTAEYEARTARAQERMAERGLEGMLLSTEADVRYFTGFHTAFWQSPTRPWFVLLPAAGKPVAVIPEIGVPLMRTTWVDDIRSWPAPDPDDDGVSLLIELLSPLSRLGLPMGHETHLRMPLADWTRMRAALPGLEIEDATEITQGLRAIKSEAEIAKIAHICAIGARAFSQVPEFALTGAPLDGVFRAFRRAALTEGADEVPYLVGAAAQGGYADVISPPDAQPLATGDILMLDSGCSWDGYFCDFDRNWAIGPPTDAARRAYDTLWTATQAGIDAARPGATCRDLYDAMARSLGTSGGNVGRLGHGLGMQLTEQPSLAAFDETPLAAGMVLTIEPSLPYGDGLMMVHEENIVVQDGPAALLTPRAEPELPVIG
ncbi:aminopeptidase P family protein [Sulfitobacter albidus]|uniref:Aminopeptidase P family protein n=1 Tax=Sulfitobacter albidus TaxID=2829501 RepID=A0A975PLF9_9RHOB|nr:Xaa-Pro peptidase family protein [Sulfitobacter albidus]QUJ75634.1 aminopeptidase P family protein [Sulfitobacter albidus]